MRDWNLGPGDPLHLTLAADFRLCTPDYADDHIWELEPGGGDPPALSLRTTYGLRARQMRIFPVFRLGGAACNDPAAFASPPVLHRFAPNFLLLSFNPFPGLHVTAEYWVPESHVAAGRFTLSNQSGETLPLGMEICGQLVPLEGQPMAVVSHQSAHVLAGQAVNLVPVLFLTGGPLPGQGTHHSLLLDVPLKAGERRAFTWAQAALGSLADSFELARRTAARPWEAERARIELVNSAGTVEVFTGDPAWDAAFALSQKAAFGLFLGPGPGLPSPSFVLARQPDHGYSPCGDGTDHGHLWNGQPVLESLALAGLLQGDPGVAQGLVRNFLSVQAADGLVDCMPGLAGQRGRWQAAPLLATLAWSASRGGLDVDFLKDVRPGLEAFLQRWLGDAHDRDGDGFPEWDHVLQSGLEDHPFFSPWLAECQVGDISCVESPALAAMLCRDLEALAAILHCLEQPEAAQEFQARAGRLRSLVAECWDPSAALHRLRDRESHRSPPGKLLARQAGPGLLSVRQSFSAPLRLVICIEFKGGTLRRPQVSLRGRLSRAWRTETFEASDFQWTPGRAVVSSRGLFSSLVSLNVAGLEKRDKVRLQVMDFSGEEISALLPLWAGMPSMQQAEMTLAGPLGEGGLFNRPFGIPTAARAGPAGEAVHLPWNALVGEGLVSCGFRPEAARLVERLMFAVTANLARQRAFPHAHHAVTGAGLGERNSLQGLAPLGLFLHALGVEIQSPTRVVLRGKNPFPWPVTVQYRGLTVTRQMEKTTVVFPDGQALSLDDPTDALVTAE